MTRAKQVEAMPIRKAAGVLAWARIGGWLAMSLWFVSLVFSPASISDVSASILLVSALLLIANEMTVISDEMARIREIAEQKNELFIRDLQKTTSTEGNCHE